MEEVDVFSALAEVAWERAFVMPHVEDIETSLNYYQKALSILEWLVEPDSRQIAELNFRLCFCLEIGSKPQEVITYCQKAISFYKSRFQQLRNEVKSSMESAASPAASELDDSIRLSSNGLQNDKLLSDEEAEIETLSGLSGDLEKKIEDLQLLALNPESILSEILGMASATVKGNEKTQSSVAMSSSRMVTANSNGDFDSPTVSTAHINGAAAGVIHLVVVGRRIKRVSMSTASSE